MRTCHKNGLNLMAIFAHISKSTIFVENDAQFSTLYRTNKIAANEWVRNIISSAQTNADDQN